MLLAAVRFNIVDVDVNVKCEHSKLVVRKGAQLRYPKVGPICLADRDG
ncbi:MAG: hypothetical protein ACI9UN_000491 [Granulosicoccus sp.]|jgi:hypothetical protein